MDNIQPRSTDGFHGSPIKRARSLWHPRITITFLFLVVRSKSYFHGGFGDDRTIALEGGSPVAQFAKPQWPVFMKNVRLLPPFCEEAERSPEY